MLLCLFRSTRGFVPTYFIHGLYASNAGVSKIKNDRKCFTIYKHSFISCGKYKPESRDGDIGIHRSNYYFAPSCRFENPVAH